MKTSRPALLEGLLAVTAVLLLASSPLLAKGARESPVASLAVSGSVPETAAQATTETISPEQDVPVVASASPAPIPEGDVSSYSTETRVTGTTTTTEARAAFSDKNLAYVANVYPPTISVVDLTTLSLIDSIAFRDIIKKQQGHFLSVTQDGRHLWIGEDISTTAGYVQVVDLETGAVLKKWNVGAGVANYISRDGRWVFTSSENQDNKNINVFDTVRQEYVGAIKLGAAPHVIDSSVDGKTLWTTDGGSGNLLAFDISGLPGRLPTEPTTVIPIGGGLHALLVHPNGRHVIVGSSTEGDVVVDIPSQKIVAKVPGKPHNYDISPDGTYLLSGETDFAGCEEFKVLEHALHGTQGPLLRFINIATLNSPDPDYSSIGIEKFLNAADLGPASISHQKYDPSGKYILVTTYRLKDISEVQEGELLIVNADSLKVERIIPLPSRPHGIAFAGIGR